MIQCEKHKNCYVNLIKFEKIVIWQKVVWKHVPIEIFLNYIKMHQNLNLVNNENIWPIITGNFKKIVSISKEIQNPLASCCFKNFVFLQLQILPYLFINNRLYLVFLSSYLNYISVCFLIKSTFALQFILWKIQIIWCNQV